MGLPSIACPVRAAFAGAIRWGAARRSPCRIRIWSFRAGIAAVHRGQKLGNPTYNESLAAEIQFARVGSRYVAVIIGEDTAPELLVKDLTGAQVDEESDAFQTLLMLDCGFYGDDGQYLWTLAMDVFGTKANTILNTFQVGKMNTGEVSLGDSITYKVLFENNKLRVFNTRQLYTYDYKLVQDTNATMLGVWLEAH